VAETLLDPPSANALIIAERVFRDRDTGEWIIAGVFSKITVGRLPAVHDRFDIFFQVTNVSRPVDLRVRIEHSDGIVLVDLGGPISSKNPLEVIEMAVQVRGLILEKPGKYFVELFSHEQLLTAAPLYVMVMDEKGHADQITKPEGPPDDQRV
jgi:uncharacterized protein DUF6941